MDRRRYPEVADATERANFREAWLRGRLESALRRINLRGGQPWLDDARIARAIRNLGQAAGHRLMEVNEATTRMLVSGTVVDGLPD